MKKTSMFHINLILALGVTLVLHVVLAIILNSGTNTSLTTNVQKSVSYSSNAYASSVSAMLDETYAELSLDGTQNLVDTTGIDGQVKENLKNYELNFYTEKALNIGEGETNLIVFTKKFSDVAYFFTFPHEQLFEESPTFNFKDSSIVRNGGSVYFNIVGDLKSSLPSGIVYGEEISLIESTVGGIRSIVAMSPFNFNKQTYYVGTASDISDIAVLISKRQSDILITLGLSCTIILGLFVFIWLSVRNKCEQEQKNFEFVFYLDKFGRINKANTHFNLRFDVAEVQDKIGFVSGEDKFVLTELIDRAKTVCSIKMDVKKTRNGLKLSGREIEPAASQTNILQSSEKIQDMRGVFNRMCSREQMLFGIVEIANLKNFEVMFGEQFCVNIYHALYEKLLFRFTSIYVLPPNRIGVLMEEGKEMDFILSDLTIIMDELNKPVRVDDNLVTPGCIAGFVRADKTMMDMSFDYVTSCAYAALKRTKSEKIKHFFIYHESQKKNYQKYFDKKINIPEMLKNECFELEFQPQVSLATGKVVGFESLFRVKKQFSLEVSIFELITYAEKTGNIILLGNFIFEEGMKFAKSIEGLNISVSLNVSPLQLMQAGFVENLMNLYKKYELKKGSISLEITESHLMSTIDESMSKLEIVRNNGITIHLDDFGMTYSSLLYLKKLPIDSLKIDREFIIDIDENEYSKAIVGFIVGLAKQLGLEVIAEGIETQKQMKVLKELKCDIIQGYLSGKSMSADRARDLLC